MTAVARNIWVVIPAAGSGSRFGSDTPKQFLTLAGKFVIEHSLLLFSQLDEIAGIAVVGNPSDTRWPNLLAKYPKTQFIAGGKERMDSVKAGVEFVLAKARDAYVMVHDAARPCLRSSDCRALIAAQEEHREGVILAYRVSDSMKRVVDHQVVNSVTRNELFHAVTPQCAPAALLNQALNRCKEEGVGVTDEAQALELFGAKVGIVEGRRDNLKITYPTDLAIVESIMEQRV